MASTFRGRSAAVEVAPAEVVPAMPFDSRGEMMRLDMEMAQSLSRSELVPREYRGKPANILVAMGLGRALGIEPIPSLYALHVIEGTPSPTAKTQQALVRRAGHKFRVIESTSQVATVEIERCDDPGHPVRVSYSTEDARVGGLLDRWVERWITVDGRSRKEVWTIPVDAPPASTVGEDLPGAPPWAKGKQISRRDSWWKVPRDMLMARATTTCVGQACSEVLSGIDFDTAWQAESYDTATIADVEIAEAVEESDANREGGSDDGEPLDGEVSTANEPIDDGADSHDVGRSEPEVRSADAADREVGTPNPTSLSTPTEDPLASDETRAKATAAKAAARAAGHYREFTEALRAEGIPLTPHRWTEGQALQVIEIAGGLA